MIINFSKTENPASQNTGSGNSKQISENLQDCCDVFRMKKQ